MTGSHDAELIGVSAALVFLKDDFEHVTMSDANVLISGDNGMGKSVVARAIHRRSRRSSRSFVSINCAGMSDALLQSALFGDVKGNNKNAPKENAGLLEAADRGTLFIDEVSEMSARMQETFAEFIETGMVRRVGSEGTGRRVSVRIISAVSTDLYARVQQGQFREDLFYRLNMVHLVLVSGAQQV